jgi:hypothetical protein
MQTDRFKEDVSKKFSLNEAIKDVSSAFGSALKKPDTHVTYNTIAEDDKKDNTMLYVGIGGAALLVVLLIVFMR